METFQDLNPNTLSMMWMVPQYFVITVGEILFSATGLTFVYTQVCVIFPYVSSMFKGQNIS